MMYRIAKFVEEFSNVYRLTGKVDIEKTFFIPKLYANYRKLRRISEEQMSQIYNFWSLSEGMYWTISFMSQPKIRHKSFSVLVDTSLLCFKR